jgi:hypothetical protein
MQRGQFAPWPGPVPPAPTSSSRDALGPMANMTTDPLVPPSGPVNGNPGGAPGHELGETFAQLLASNRECHLFGGGHVDEHVVAV